MPELRSKRDPDFSLVASRNGGGGRTDRDQPPHKRGWVGAHASCI